MVIICKFMHVGCTRGVLPAQTHQHTSSPSLSLTDTHIHVCTLFRTRPPPPPPPTHTHTLSQSKRHGNSSVPKHPRYCHSLGVFSYLWHLPDSLIYRVQCCFTSTIDTVQTISDGEPRRSISSSRSSALLEFEFSVALRPQRPQGLLNTWTERIQAVNSSAF